MDEPGGKDVIDLLVSRGLNGTPDAVEFLRATEQHVSIVDEFIEDNPDAIVIGLDDAKSYRNNSIHTSNELKKSNKVDDINSSTPLLDVKGDITGRSTCTGEYDDFVRYFRDRFNRLRGLVEKRMPYISINEATKKTGEVSVIGMINDVGETSTNKTLIELEDPSGRIRVLLDQGIQEDPEALVTDEVVGVSGQISKDGGIIYADSMVYPDIPRGEPTRADTSIKAIFISDLHVGSDNFEENKWHEFTDWVSNEGDVDYILVAGDLVDGVGVYPGQKDELEVVDIYEQYSRCAEMFKEIPGDIEIITITGNHDAVRLAEPQPAIEEEMQKPFDSNVRFHGNPSLVQLDGVKILMYHGTSLNSFIEEIPDASIDAPASIMTHMLKKRHLAPMYGRGVRIAPEERDHLVIDEVPDIFHSGHIHKKGAGLYKSVLMLNTGTWQSQTQYQKNLNIQPDVGFAVEVDLSTYEKRFISF